MQRCSVLGLIGAVLVGLGGCGNPDAPNVSGSTETAAVKGTVKVHGKHVTNGTVSFQARNINRPNAPAVIAEIDKNGAYKAEPLIGENMVEVNCKEIRNHRNMSLQDNEQPVKIKTGEQLLDIELPSNLPLEPK